MFPYDRQYPVTDRHGKMKVDFAWPPELLALEAEGFSIHNGRVQFHRDRQRVRRLLELGWRVVPVTWWDVVPDPTAFLTQLAAIRRKAA